jgi:hypothetical protein
LRLGKIPFCRIKSRPLSLEIVRRSAAASEAGF